jgi:hypothetical protein
LRLGRLLSWQLKRFTTEITEKHREEQDLKNQRPSHNSNFSSTPKAGSSSLHIHYLFLCATRRRFTTEFTENHREKHNLKKGKPSLHN